MSEQESLIAYLLDENARLKTALARYADEYNWISLSKHKIPRWNTEWIGGGEGYDLARAALGQEEKP